MEAHDIKIDSDEDEFSLHIYDENGNWKRFLLPAAVAEKLHDAARREIGPWIYEKDQAKEEVDEGWPVPRFALGDPSAYGLNDPKHPDYHSVMSEISDTREL